MGGCHHGAVLPFGADSSVMLGISLRDRPEESLRLLDLSVVGGSASCHLRAPNPNLDPTPKTQKHRFAHHLWALG